MNKLVSVLIPTYNRMDLLTHAIRSVLRQSYPHVEIIVVDDGSTDRTEDMVKMYGKSVQYIRIAHSGLPGVVRNAGLIKAKGEFVAFLDDDDEWLPKKLEIQILAMFQSKCLCSSTNAWRVRNGKKIGLYLIEPIPEKITFENLLITNYIICSSAVVHKSIFEMTGYFSEAPDLRGLEDYAIWLRIATQTNWVYLHEPLTHYNDMPSQSIRHDGVSMFEQNRRVFRDFKIWAKSAHIDQSLRWDVQKRLIAITTTEIRRTLGTLLLRKSA